MEKEQKVLYTTIGVLCGLLVGMMLGARKCKIHVDGNNNTIRTGYKSYAGNHNGNNNGSPTMTKTKNKDKKNK